jgi:hypothetical protein
MLQVKAGKDSAHPFIYPFSTSIAWKQQTISGYTRFGPELLQAVTLPYQLCQEFPVWARWSASGLGHKWLTQQPSGPMRITEIDANQPAAEFLYLKHGI